VMPTARFFDSPNIPSWVVMVVSPMLRTWGILPIIFVCLRKSEWNVYSKTDFNHLKGS
jgi:hypothetical protein